MIYYVLRWNTIKINASSTSVREFTKRCPWIRRCWYFRSEFSVVSEKVGNAKAESLEFLPGVHISVSRLRDHTRLKRISLHTARKSFKSQNISALLWRSPFKPSPPSAKWAPNFIHLGFQKKSQFAKRKIRKLIIMKNLVKLNIDIQVRLWAFIPHDCQRNERDRDGNPPSIPKDHICQSAFGICQ